MILNTEVMDAEMEGQVHKMEVGPGSQRRSQGKEGSAELVELVAQTKTKALQTCKQADSLLSFLKYIYSIYLLSK